MLSGKPCGPTEYDCEKCAHFSFNKTSDNKVQCVSYCPVGYYADYTTKTCQKCSDNCTECRGPGENNCTKCTDAFLKTDTHECTKQCPDIGFYTSNYIHILL